MNPASRWRRNQCGASLCCSPQTHILLETSPDHFLQNNKSHVLHKKRYIVQSIFYYSKIHKIFTLKTLFLVCNYHAKALCFSSTMTYVRIIGRCMWTGSSEVTNRCSMIWLRRTRVCHFSCGVIGSGGTILSCMYTHNTEMVILRLNVQANSMFNGFTVNKFR